ncbi:MAG: hypothetical protein IT267_00865 [Saprospiraceae bacterium]|nr:hypothetical protein [Saprospiraceae bacterium]
MILILVSCLKSNKTKIDNPQSDEKSIPDKSISEIDNNLSSDYWFQGKAEVNSYTLSQARYGQMRKGDAVLIFVTEDFSKGKQVKLDHPNEVPEDRQPVFKLNMMKRFNTGIYTYNLMMSVFSPVGNRVSPYPLKVTASIQDWCGQVFNQFNQIGNQFLTHSYSYFESESDQQLQLKQGWTEDGLWNQIRIDPSRLPIGEVEMFPSYFYLRLKHKPQEFVKAIVSLNSINDSIQTYEIVYPSDDRILKIDFERNIPYRIRSWAESYKDGDGILTTKAVLKKSIMVDYWLKNSVKDSTYRELLELN